MSDWPTHQAQHAHMKLRQRQNRAKRVSAEDWMAAKLAKTSWTWTRQAQWGFRLFDFWCRDLGIAIEVDGPNHSRPRDEASDQRMWTRSGIFVWRVKNFDNEMADQLIASIPNVHPWNDRRVGLGMKPLKL